MTLEIARPEQNALLTIALMAAFADGGKSDLERAEVKRIAESLPTGDINPAALYQRVLLRRPTAVEAAAPLTTPALCQLAYEIAVGVCEADDRLNPAETAFLAELRQALGIDPPAADAIQEQADAVALAPLTAPAVATGPVPPVLSARQPDADLDRMILNYSILNGALELLPESLATMAIVPLQMKMVYRVGKHHGYELDRRHITELLGAAGVGLTSQVVEGFARKLLGGLLGKVTGGLGRRTGNQLASSAMSFASTYALGQLAQRYYAGGRQLSALQLRDLFTSLAGQGQSLHDRYAGEIQQRARSLNPAQLLSLVRGQPQSDVAP
ncbi:MAG: GTPase [Verrucomicrobia bacterium]|nr:GTPase [Verrucomicrobiota bacterium]